MTGTPLSRLASSAWRATVKAVEDNLRARRCRVQAADDLVPLAVLVVRVVGLVVEHNDRATAIHNALVKILDPRSLRARLLIRAPLL
jgi:hypothetical protein